MPSLKQRRPFITGSHRYGTPKPESDVDLVVRIDRRVFDTLESQADSSHSDADDYGCFETCSLRFGNLNIIACLSDAGYDGWREGTEKCVDACKEPWEDGKPKLAITRQEAVEIIQNSLGEYGIYTE